jgi:hypothetical protein
MREVKLSDGSTREVGPLTRAQMKSMADMGIDARGFGPTGAQFDAAFNSILATQFSDKDLDALPFPDCRELFFGIVKETWGAQDEEKNLSGSGPSDQTLIE